MEAAGPGPASEYLLERDHAREKIRKLREKLVYRCKNLDKWQFIGTEPTVPPADPQEAEAEQQARRRHGIALSDIVVLVWAIHTRLLAAALPT